MTLPICKLKIQNRGMSQKSSYTGYKLNREICCLLIFVSSKKLAFDKYFIFANQAKVFISLTSSFVS